MSDERNKTFPREHQGDGGMIAALFVEEKGVYSGLPDVDVWGVSRDARQYRGPWPAVAHPPCHLWTNIAAVNWRRYKRQRPAWYAGGDDSGCFEAALLAVQQFGGVLEHPAFSHAWKKFGIRAPTAGAWARDTYAWDGGLGWVCEVWQSAYGHKARKATWLYYCGHALPPELDWSRKPGTHQCGWFDRIKPTLSKLEASATPLPFRDLLLSIARGAR